ncbi:hypothetical protein [Candidatus Tokpelaia sp.]|uniref:hypothetical protein n=1 Tax=Candidatus Tokpelaia sp. TaxID=2233777 RepID=UPI0016803B07|nr:hypothetical protein [Candidatus Tokpelaia sp.]
MRKTLFIAGLSVLAALPVLPARANDANTVFNGISAATGVIGVFQQSKTNRYLNNIEQGQQESNYREERRDAAADRAAASRAAANRRAAAQKAAADRQAAENARIQAAEATARQDAARKQQLDALKYD